MVTLPRGNMFQGGYKKPVRYLKFAIVGNYGASKTIIQNIRIHGRVAELSG
jgi:hypothetical protein